ncbi:hypothetical protein JKP88DRAFT_244962 [Tribonema minus]|uniref:Uncharacterized protein n=1 Tax=Tribonema minus TaxID=303371 RepID=A0A835Z0C9_9STRA|nr:hypothetical protein JKP88DRAFT_244962 [Tribonema minus]
MVKTPRNTRQVPIVNNMFATNTGDVTLIGPDDQVWQNSRPAGTLKLVSSQASSYKDASEPAIPARDHVGEYALGSNQQLFESVKIGEGMYRWQKVENRLADNTNGFVLPSGRQEVARLDPAAIDADGVILRIFVGSLACYKRADALPVMWDGFDFFDIDGRYLHVPERFKRGIPSTMGLEGIIYIPQEEYLEDLLISLDEQELSFPPEYYKQADFDKIGVRPDGRHDKTQRKVGFLDARGCFESAWEAAVFEVTDVFTMPGATFAERRNMLETFLKPLKDSYKQIRLLPVMPILSQEWAVSAYENTPVNANLVIIDPESMYEHPVGPKERKDKPRRQFEKKEKASPLVGWKLDGSGKLEAVVVEGNNSQKSAIVVYPGQLWVDVRECKDMSDFRRKKAADLQKFNKSPAGYEDIKLPMEFVSKMKKAYEDDLNAQTSSYNALISPTYAFKARERAMKSILNTVATKIWKFTAGGGTSRRPEFAGINVTERLVECVTEYVTSFVPYHFDIVTFWNGLTGAMSVAIEELMLFNKDLISNFFNASLVHEPNVATMRSLFMNNINVDPKRAEQVGIQMVKAQRLLMATDFKFAVPGLTGDERRFAMNHLIRKIFPSEVLKAFIHTDQDFFSPLKADIMARSMDITVPNITSLYPPNRANECSIPIEAPPAAAAGGGPPPVVRTIEINYRALADIQHSLYDVAGAIIQGGYIPKPTFAAPQGEPYQPVDAGSSKNLMAWGSTQIVNYQRAFPYGALIGYKIQKGGENNGVAEDDLYTMTKVTIV